MSKLAAELNELPVESVDVLPADMLEALESGHGSTEIAASCVGGFCICLPDFSCIPCFKPDDDDVPA